MVLKRIKDVIGWVPTIIESGHGLHILQPVLTPTLEDFFFATDRPSNAFLRFAERYLSNGLTDPNHNIWIMYAKNSWFI
jgi:hypothetical protein